MITKKYMNVNEKNDVDKIERVVGDQVIPILEKQLLTSAQAVYCLKRIIERIKK